MEHNNKMHSYLIDLNLQNRYSVSLHLIYHHLFGLDFHLLKFYNLAQSNLGIPLPKNLV